MKLIKQFIYILIIITIINIGALTSAHAAISTDNLINLVNSSRTQNSLNTLTTNAKLQAAASAKASDILKSQYFAHTSPSGKTPWTFISAADYNYVYAGENLAIGYTDNAELHTAWMNSPSHRENILNPNFREIGIAQVTGTYEDAETTIVVQMFGSTESSQPAVNSEVAAASDTNETSPSNSDTGTNLNIGDQTHEKSFGISDQSGFSPNKVWSNENVTYKAVITGEISEIYFKIGDQKVDFKGVEPKTDGDLKIYEKNEKMLVAGDKSVVLTVTDQWGNTENKDFGKLTVSEKTVTKNSNAGGQTFWEKTINFALKNAAYLSISLLVLMIGTIGFLILRREHFNPRSGRIA